MGAERLRALLADMQSDDEASSRRSARGPAAVPAIRGPLARVAPGGVEVTQVLRVRRDPGDLDALKVHLVADDLDAAYRPETWVDRVAWLSFWRENSPADPESGSIPKDYELNIMSADICRYHLSSIHKFISAQFI